MQNVDEYELKPTNTNVNTLMQRVLDRINQNESHPVSWSLSDVINQEMMNLAQKIDYDELHEVKQYEFSCEIELYPMVQYIDANTAEEAIELMEKQISDESFLHDLDTRDFHCTTANIVKETKEYKNWRESHKEQS